MVGGGEKRVPGLRFGEFVDEWSEKNGSQLFENSRVKGEKGLPIYSVTLNNGLVPRNSLERKMENDAADEVNLRAQPGDLVYNMMRMWQGAVGLADTECMISPAYIVLSGKKDTNTKFFNYNLERSRPLYDLWAYSYGLTNDRLRLYFKDFGQIRFWVPPKKKEQQKIATFLGSVDARLKQLRRMHEQLQTYKRGLMQKIFSQELRFKQDDETNFPEWEKKKLEEVFSGSKGQGLSKDNIVRKGINKCILYGELYTTYPEVIKNIKSQTNIDSGVRSEIGDILIPCSTTTTGIDLADATVVNENGVLIGGDISILRFRKKGVSEFFAYYLTHYKKIDIAKYGQGSTIVHLYFSHFKNIDVEIPVLEEQQRIATFLSAIDKKIDAVSTQIKKTETFKKGLLQKMFV